MKWLLALVCWRKVFVFVFFFLNKTCPSHQKLPRVSVTWSINGRSPVAHASNACNHNIIESMSKLCFYTKLKRIPSRPSPPSIKPQTKKQKRKSFSFDGLVWIQLGFHASLQLGWSISSFLNRKGSCHAPYSEQWSHKPQFCIAIPSQFHKDK